MAESEGVGPFLDEAEDFGHLAKIKVSLVVRSVDDDEEFRNRDEIEVSRDENLFEVLVRRVAFEEWYRLTAVVGGDVTQMYKFHGKEWFESGPVECRLGAKESVDHMQARLHALERGVSVVLLLEVREKVVETTREAVNSEYPSTSKGDELSIRRYSDIRVLLCQLAAMGQGVSCMHMNNTTGVQVSDEDLDHAFEVTYATVADNALDTLRMVSTRFRSVVDKVRKPIKLTMKEGWLFSQMNDFEVSSQEADRILAGKIETVLHDLEDFSSRRNITSIELKHLPMSAVASVDRFVGVLRNSPALTHLCLFGNRLGNAGIRNIAWDAIGTGFCTALSHLDLGRNNINPVGMLAVAAALYRCVNLTHLDVSNNKIYTGHLFGHIITNCTLLSHLDLHDNGMNAVSMRDFNLSMTNLSHLSLTVLDLNDNRIGDEGIEHLVSVLQKCTGLTRLSIGRNEITGRGIDTLGDCLTTLHYLDISYNNIGDSLHKVLPGCTVLTHLAHKRTGINDLTLLAPALQRCTALLYLDLGQNNLGWEITKFVDNRVTTLTHLDLSSNALEQVDEGDDEEYTTFMTNWQNWIQECTSLAYLDLGTNNIEWPVAQFNNCPSITHLDLSNNSYFTLRGLQLTNLTHLIMHGNQSLQAFDLVHLTNLRHLDLCDCDLEPTIQFVNAMQNCSALTHLELQCNDMQADLVPHIVNVMTMCTQLTLLDLSHNQFGDAGARLFVDVLPTCTALKLLNLKYNGVSFVQRQELKQAKGKDLVLIQLEEDDEQAGTDHGGDDEAEDM